MKYNAILFDLDGTLLESLEDIKNAVNKSLEECGYSLRYDYEGAKKLIGNGVFVLIDRAIAPLHLTKQEHDKFQEVMLKNYKLEQGRCTKPFQGEKEALTKLKELGYKLFVVTNKPQFLMEEILSKTYGKDFFTEAVGQSESSLPKPNPKSINDLVAKHNLDKSKIIYVGDSSVDLDTASNAGIESVLVTFGYDEYTSMLKAKATYVVNSIDEFLDLFE